MTNETLAEALNNLKTDLINSLQAKGSLTTGQTAQQITIIQNGNQTQLQLPGYLVELENGRGPTNKNATPGNPPMIQRIQQWCRAKASPTKPPGL